MLYFLAGVATLAAAGGSGWLARPIDGKINPRITPLVEPYLAIGIVGLIIFGFGLFVLGLVEVMK